MAIIAKKAQMRDLDLPDGAVHQIAVRVQTNTRELEGAVTRVQSLAALTQRPITVELVEEALGHYVDAGKVKVNINQILDLVTQRFEVRLADLQSKKRSKSITLPRQVCMYLARNFTDHSLEEIGGYFGGRDHTTVMHATRTIQRQRQDNPRLAATLDRIELALHARRESPRDGS
jgi:chromosomal replication initiator protein